MNWQGSAMQRNGVACTDCHTAHAAKDPVLVKATQPEKCFTCHAEQRADSFKYSHHPIREGLVVCSDCHNPHGSPGDTKSLKEFTVNETCYNCHADKRGPMLWEHQPVRDNCLNCHTPHGSNQPRLLMEPIGLPLLVLPQRGKPTTAAVPSAVGTGPIPSRVANRAASSSTRR